MKKFYIILIALLMVSGAMAQTGQPCSTCLPEGITFEHQYHIDNFQTNYPGCTGIDGSVTISGGDITNLNGLSVLTSIGGGLWIEGNATLTSLTGLNNLTSIGGDLYISAHNSLTSLTGLDNVTSIGGTLIISGNLSLTSLTGLDNLTSIGSDLYISANLSLTSLTGLDNVTSIGGKLQIGNFDYGANPSLTSLTGLGALISIGSDLHIENNYALTSITGLEGLTSIGGYLTINYNNALTTLAGLDNINAGSIIDLVIANNYSLSTCEVESICNYLASPSGTIYIQSNATGCNSPEEVDSACVYLSNGEITLEPAFSIYPNPSSTNITITTPTTQQNNATLTIHNINGQQILKRQSTDTQTVVDVSGLNAGVYLVRVVSDDGVTVGKFVKQ